MEKCSFCNRTIDDVEILIRSKTSNKTYICDKCINLGLEKYQNMKQFMKLLDTSTSTSTSTSKFTPRTIYDKLNEYIIGQDDAKKILSVAIYNHQKRIIDHTGKIKKSNILIAGPSGSGKTLLAKTIADIIDVPFAIADATSLTEAGYVGDDVESILQKLILAANGDIARAEKGIVFIDEIDKLASSKSRAKAGNRNPTSDGVQFALLKLIEGSTIAINQPDSNRMAKNKIMFDTTNVLFICGGAFEGLFDRKETKSIGFNASLSTLEDEKEVNTDNLKNYGMKSEFIGRLPIRVKLNELTKQDLVKILKEPKNSIVSEYKELFSQDGIDLEITDDALLMIADIAIDTKIGARGLRTIMEDIMMDIMFEAPDHPDYNKIVITEDTIKTKAPIIYTTENIDSDHELEKI